MTENKPVAQNMTISFDQKTQRFLLAWGDQHQLILTRDVAGNISRFIQSQMYGENPVTELKPISETAAAALAVEKMRVNAQ